MGETFREKLCSYYGVPPHHYDETVLRLTLYPHARCLRLLGRTRLLEPDREFVAEAGGLTRWRGFAAVAWSFQGDPRNREFARRVLRFRISVWRMRSLFSEVWGHSIPANTAPPFPAEPARDPASYLTD